MPPAAHQNKTDNAEPALGLMVEARWTKSEIKVFDESRKAILLTASNQSKIPVLP
jgi:hypothetical protein